MEGPKNGSIRVQVKDKSGRAMVETVPANASGTTTVSRLDVEAVSFEEGIITLTAQWLDDQGRLYPEYTGVQASYDKTAPTMVSIIAGTAGTGIAGLDTAGDAVIFESKEPLLLTNISGVLSNYKDPTPDTANRVGETSDLINALNVDLPYNSSAAGEGSAGTWGLQSDTTGADIDVSSIKYNLWYWRLSITYKNIGSTGFSPDIVNGIRQYLLPNPETATIAITDLAGNKLQTERGSSAQAVDYDDINDVDVTEQ